MFVWVVIYSIFAVRFTGCSVARSSRLLWEQEVAGSNPATPTKHLGRFDMVIASRCDREGRRFEQNEVFSRLGVILPYGRQAATPTKHLPRDVAQPGSAHAWGAWGRRFKSCHPDFFFLKVNAIAHSDTSEGALWFKHP